METREISDLIAKKGCISKEKARHAFSFTARGLIHTAEPRMSPIAIGPIDSHYPKPPHRARQLLRYIREGADVDDFAARVALSITADRFNSIALEALAFSGSEGDSPDEEEIVVTVES